MLMNAQPWSLATTWCSMACCPHVGGAQCGKATVHWPVISSRPEKSHQQHVKLFQSRSCKRCSYRHMLARSTQQLIMCTTAATTYLLPALASWSWLGMAFCQCDHLCPYMPITESGLMVPTKTIIITPNFKMVCGLYWGSLC